MAVFRSMLAGVFSVAVLFSADVLAAPDIFPAQLTVPEEVVIGQPVDVSATFSSRGRAAMGFEWAVYLTTNGILDGAVELARFGPVVLGPDQVEVTVTETVIVPEAFGGRRTFVVLADPDGLVAEADEFNNRLRAGVLTVVRPPLPEFSVSATFPRVTDADVGTALDFDATLSNSGEQGGVCTFGLFLSRNRAFSPEDVQIGELAVRLEAGQSREVRLRGFVSEQSAAGAQYLLAVADPEGFVAEIDELNNAAVADEQITIRRRTVEFTTGSLPFGVVFAPYHAQLTALGGDGRYNYRILSGVLPDGLTLERSGRIVGAPLDSGAHSVTVRLDSGGRTATKTFEMRIEESGLHLQIRTEAIGSGSLGRPFTANLLAGGGEPPYVFSQSGGVLPPGLDLGPRGHISGQPTEEGAFEFQIAVQDAIGARVEQAFSIDIHASSVTVLTRQFPDVVVGEPLSFILEASGGLPTYVWTPKSDMPPGLSMSRDGRISGTPTQVGEFALRVLVTDSSASEASDTALVHFRFIPGGTFEFAAPDVSPVFTREVFAVVLEAEGGVPPLTWSISREDRLPTGVELVVDPEAPEHRALIRGSSIRPLDSALTVRVDDAVGRRREGLVLISVKPVDQATVGGCNHTPVSGSSASFGLLLLSLACVRRRVS